jgi:hypothetical protein
MVFLDVFSDLERFILLRCIILSPKSCVSRIYDGWKELHIRLLILALADRHRLITQVKMRKRRMRVSS